MKTRADRWSKIKSYLRTQSEPSTVTEIFEALTRQNNLETCRKTISRDLFEMMEAGIVGSTPGIPQRFVLMKSFQIELSLTLEELDFLLSIIPQQHQLYSKMRRIESD